MVENSASAKSDPLSPATRNAKRHLLLVGVVAITFKAFQVSIEKIPVAGLVINFDRGVFEFLLAIALLYLLATFALYYYIDIRNFPPTPHQERTAQWREQSIEEFVYRWYETVSDKMNAVMPDGFRAMLAPEYQNLLRDVVEPSRTVRRLDEMKRRGIIPRHADEPGYKNLIMISGPGGLPGDKLRREGDERCKEILQNSTIEFETAYENHLRRLKPRLFVVSAAYFTRNFITDGAIPLAIGIIGLLSLYNIIDLHFLSQFVPHDK